MGAIVDRLAAYFLPLAIIAAVTLAGLLGIQTVRLANTKADLASKIAEHEKDRADAQEQLRLAERRVAARVQEAAIAQQRASDDFATERAALTADVGTARAQLGRMRRDIEDFLSSAPRSDGAAGETAPATAGDYRNRAATLGELLNRCVGRYRGVAQAADRHVSEVRALKRQIAADRLACEVK